MKTISAVELRNDLEGIVKALRKGERMELTYRGETVAELIPTKLVSKLTPLEALKRAQEITARDPDYPQKAEAYLRELREDQKAWGERSP
ncbi:MAG TPA: type II toxin-antitoxin system Phd/YefM family antitoxin [Opitutaceae bacterium]|nr:type II toxin-antitoxin system Phd/YefM family antitoxin [Opitutaceae bacterium]